LDVHQATISVAVRDSAGKLVMEAVLETKAETILQLIHGRTARKFARDFGRRNLCGVVALCAEAKPHAARVLVCDPRKNALIKAGNKSDRIDARKLADLLYLDKLHPVFHGETGNQALKKLARSYLALTRDTTRVMNRSKALYRSWAIPCTGQRVYAPRYRSALSEPGPSPKPSRLDDLQAPGGAGPLLGRATIRRDNSFSKSKERTIPS
jgi:hypothetical protein